MRRVAWDIPQNTKSNLVNLLVIAHFRLFSTSIVHGEVESEPNNTIRVEPIFYSRMNFSIAP